MGRILACILRVGLSPQPNRYALIGDLANGQSERQDIRGRRQLIRTPQAHKLSIRSNGLTRLAFQARFPDRSINLVHKYSNDTRYHAHIGKHPLGLYGQTMKVLGVAQIGLTSGTVSLDVSRDELPKRQSQ